MSRRQPDFDELVGMELPSRERERLLKVHELLLEAGPPPDLVAPAPRIEVRPRRRRGVLLALAATFVVAAFAVGVLVGDRAAGPNVDFAIAMRGTTDAPAASATLTVFELDDAGNWPMELEVDGLPASASGRPFQLWLTRSGELVELCGAFQTGADGSVTVPMNAPYKFKEFDGWVVVEEGKKIPLLTA